MGKRDLSTLEHHLFVCQGDTCKKNGAKQLRKNLKQAVEERGLKKSVLVTKTECLDRCNDKCTAVDYPAGVWYKDLNLTDAPKLAEMIETNDVWPEKTSYIRDERGFSKEMPSSVKVFYPEGKTKPEKEKKKTKNKKKKKSN
ncbi:(2Fe-2S) ferredoxin domain-containing protein [Salisediminibacterium halotolerans]|uniref:(2Fe-2S) ferredoxin domain-containing protein n=1 Tax=Salisediminibacterium halotolerans TaxID=517425 RepID=UPI000EB3AF6D|nr:(2Fe-2S) ferredoxin domain-containing protein [Salisediminibacterium halotolerans]RLJ78205.1 hypothetical protein BCL39_0675 [Actinophytocola xinjiangensis]RPE88456.1 hypothetical protein EDD67_0784 [Salisediminibacterium halotolerans]TWG37182.1 hypothetical protein BCL52_0674 [Salisediminibacterium halotolerans]GEL09144.1 hypothetical protein SHA02_25600 [Salisediminibacterium halotolerans]